MVSAADPNDARGGDDRPIDCRPGCGACCVAPSISSPIPGMPGGKPAGVTCIHLTADYSCGIFHAPDRPPVCASLQARQDMCGGGRRQALDYLAELERLTAPD